MKDTVYYSDKKAQKVDKLLDRSRVWAGQAPEVFDFDKYFNANARLSYDEMLHIHGSSEAAIMASMNIAMIPGDEENFKITTNIDLENFKRKIIK